MSNTYFLDTCARLQTKNVMLSTQEEIIHNHEFTATGMTFQESTEHCDGEITGKIVFSQEQVKMYNSAIALNLL